MTKIVRADAMLLKRKHTVLTTSYGKAKQEKEHVIVVLEDEKGNRGYGEATPLPKFSGETAEIVKAVLLSELLTLLPGLDSSAIALIHQKMDKQIFGNRAAKCAIDCALYDLTANSLHIPLFELLGGKVRDKVPINRHIGIVSMEETVRLAQEYKEQGFCSLKIKVGTDTAMDTQRIHAIRKIMGPDAKLRIDGNNGLHWNEACSLIEAIQDCDLEFYEQLLPKWDLTGMKELKRKYGIRIAIDEALNTLQDAVRYAEAEAADAFVIKLVKCGGLYPALSIAAVAQAYGLPVIVTSTYDTQIGCAACLELACALPNAETGCDLTAFAIQPEWAEMDHRLQGMLMECGSAPGMGIFAMKDFPME